MTDPGLDAYRHRWEMPLVYAAAAIAAAEVIVLLVLVTAHKTVPDWLSISAGAALLMFILVPFILPFKYWEAAANSVEVSPRQFPEVYEVYLELVRALNLEEVPRLYVKNGNGLLNAYSAKCGVTRRFVVVYSDIVDTFYELGDKDTLRFVLGHELGHIKLGHVNIRRLALANFLRPLFLEPTFSRAQEYSADRVGAAIASQGTATRSLSMLFAGKRQYQHMDLPSYIAGDTRHVSRFWLGLVNFKADHPVGRRRLAAAYRMDQEGWQHVHGEML